MATINDMNFGSDSEDGEDFSRASQRADGDEEEEEEEEEEGDGEEQTRNEGDDGARQGSVGDIDEDEEEEDDEEITDRPRKRARRDRRNQFIEDEAEVDDEDEADEEDEEEGLHGDFIAKDHPDDIGDLPQGAETDDRRHRELDRKREMEAQIDAEEEAAQLRERHRKRQVTSQQVSQVPRRMLLPSVDDPSIWGVRCKPGKEREVVFSVLKRLEDRANSKTPLPIYSAFERGTTSMSGYVYVEARKQSDVLDSLDGLLNVYPRTKMVLVAIKEMPDLLRVQQSEQLQPGGYVRIKRGKYQGDLAQIDDVESNGLEATLRIVPRLDYGLNEDTHGPASEGVIGPDGKRKRPGGFGANKPGTRPPQRLFSESEARKKHSKYLQTMSTFDKKQWTYLGDTYVNGFLVKDFKIQHLLTQNVNPSLEEVTRFAAGSEDGTENLDLTALAASLKNNTSSDSYLPGDTVEVYEGEQQGITGKATSVRGDIVTLTVTEGELKGRTLDVPMKGLRKRFREGDHVKIIGGSRFRDEVGMVVRIKDDKVTLVSDLTMQEITVFSKDLREATDTGAAGGLGLYDIHDLVQLDAATVGCVTKVDRESLRILDQNGTLRTLMPSQISNKIDRRRHAVATDRNGAEIRQDDTVKETGGENRQGIILHIHRSFLFCHNREQPENSGIFVVRASNVTTIAAKGGRVASQTQTGPDLSRMNPAMQRQNGRGGQNGAMPPPKSFGRDPSLGKTVNIRKGPYKGLLGIVRDTTDNEARIELHTKNKIIQVSKDALGFKDPISGATLSYSDFTGRGRGRGAPSGGATPMRSGSGFGGATPSRDGWGSGGQTPLGGRDGGRTPAWGMAGGRTPAWGGGGGGGGGDSYSRSSSARTPAWGGGGGGGGGSSGFGGGRTPAWSGGATAYGGATTNSGSRTPAWGGDGSRTSYGDASYGSSGGFGGRTPAYNPDGGRTPGYAGDAPTPASDPWARPSDAPTPAASAPTPRDAPTPGGYSKYPEDAPTPAAGAPTPFGGGPETPAAWGGDDDEDTGPRYVDDD